MVRKKITQWLKHYAKNNKMSGFVVGVSGGIDSAVVSTLCAETGLPTLAVSIPINQDKTLDNRSEIQKKWLKQKYKNIAIDKVDLSQAFNEIKMSLNTDNLGLANTKSRLRMVALYALASPRKYLVVGTGNKVEDFGVGFFTKYGDGGVDISPIADLMKSEVYEIAKELNIPKEIQEAAPTDGLWEDGRTDESQIGASYKELEWAMNYIDSNSDEVLNSRQKKVVKIFLKFRKKNEHKIKPIPVFKINDLSND